MRSQLRGLFCIYFVLEHGRKVLRLLGLELLLWLHFDDGAGLLQTRVQVFVQHDMLLRVVVLPEWTQRAPNCVEVAIALRQHQVDLLRAQLLLARR